MVEGEKKFCLESKDMDILGSLHTAIQLYTSANDSQCKKINVYCMASYGMGWDGMRLHWFSKMLIQAKMFMRSPFRPNVRTKCGLVSQEQPELRLKNKI